MSIQVTLQQFGGASAPFEKKIVSPEMPLGQLRQLARDLINPKKPGPGAVYVGSVCVALLVGEHLYTEMEMDDTLRETNISNGTTVIMVRLTSQLIPPLIQQAEDKLSEAVAKIEDAKQWLRHDNPDVDNPGLDTAQRRLQDYTYPMARSAADANQHLRRVLKFYLEEGGISGVSLITLKKVERLSREIVVLLCRATLKDQTDWDKFIMNLQAAYESKVDGDLYAQLMLAYHKDPTTQHEGFPSANSRLGGPRPRRRPAIV